MNAPHYPLLKEWAYVSGTMHAEKTHYSRHEKHIPDGWGEAIDVAHVERTGRFQRPNLNKTSRVGSSIFSAVR
jgi:hypothetical protein